MLDASKKLAAAALAAALLAPGPSIAHAAAQIRASPARPARTSLAPAPSASALAGRAAVSARASAPASAAAQEAAAALPAPLAAVANPGALGHFLSAPDARDAARDPALIDSLYHGAGSPSESYAPAIRTAAARPRLAPASRRLQDPKRAQRAPAAARASGSGPARYAAMAAGAAALIGGALAASPALAGAGADAAATLAPAASAWLWLLMLPAAVVATPILAWGAVIKSVVSALSGSDLMRKYRDESGVRRFLAEGARIDGADLRASRLSDVLALLDRHEIANAAFRSMRLTFPFTKERWKAAKGLLKESARWPIKNGPRREDGAVSLELESGVSRAELMRLLKKLDVPIEDAAQDSSRGGASVTFPDDDSYRGERAVLLGEALQASPLVRRVSPGFLQRGLEHASRQEDRLPKGMGGGNPLVNFAMEAFVKRLRADAKLALAESSRRKRSEADGFAHFLEQTGNQLVGQYLSYRADLIPAEYRVKLRVFQEDGKPAPFAEVKSVLETELAKPLDELFSEFEEVPVKVGTKAQVHRAKLRGSGELVAVKVVAPSRERAIRDNLDMLREAVPEIQEKASALQANVDVMGMFREYERLVLKQLDMRDEFENARRFQAGLDRLPESVRRGIRTPALHEKLLSRRVLTMSFAPGLNPMRLAPKRRKALAQRLGRLFIALAAQAEQRHDDLHPGNIRYRAETDELWLLDAGDMGRLEPGEVQRVLRLAAAVESRNADRLAEALESLSEKSGTYDAKALRAALRSTLSRRAAGATPLSELAYRAGQHGLKLRSQYLQFIKGLSTLEGSAKELDPGFDLRAQLARLPAPSPEAADEGELRVSRSMLETGLSLLSKLGAPAAGSGGVRIPMAVPGLSALQAGDTLMRIGGRRVRNAADARAAVEALVPGEPAPVELRRGGRTIALRIRLEPDASPAASDTAELAPAPPEPGSGAAPLDIIADGDHGMAPSQVRLKLPGSIAYDLSGPEPRLIIADPGNMRVLITDLDGRYVSSISRLSADKRLRSPLGLFYLPPSRARSPELAGLYVNDVGHQQIHFLRQRAGDPANFDYVGSFGSYDADPAKGFKVPRNLVVSPDGVAYVSDEFHHSVKAFKLEFPGGGGVAARQLQRMPERVERTSSRLLGGKDAQGRQFRLPTGPGYWQSKKKGVADAVFVSDQANNRIQVYRVQQDGTLEFQESIESYRHKGVRYPLSRPRSVHADSKGNLYIANTFAHEIIRIRNLSESGGVEYSNGQREAEADMKFGSVGLEMAERMYAQGRGGEFFLIPNDFLPVLAADGKHYVRRIGKNDYALALVSDTGNLRVKKCWMTLGEDGEPKEIAFCSSQAPVFGRDDQVGKARNRTGDFIALSDSALLPGEDETLLALDFPNQRINAYPSGQDYAPREFANVNSGLDWARGILPMGIAAVRSGNKDLVVTLNTYSMRSKAYLQVYDAKGKPLHWTGVGSGARDIRGKAVPDMNFLPWSALLMTPLFKLFGSSMDFTAISAMLGVAANPPTLLKIFPNAKRADRWDLFMASMSGHVWHYQSDAEFKKLELKWVMGGSDATKGYREGRNGTFDMAASFDVYEDALFVVDRGNNRIQAFDRSTGEFLGKFGGAGYLDIPLDPAGDELLLPAGIAIDKENGIFYVSDGFNMSLKAFRAKKPLLKDGRIQLELLKVINSPELGNQPGGLFAADKIALGKDKIYVTSFVSQRIETYPRLKPGKRD